MTSRTKFWALSAGALALSLALAGCGGGGSGGSASNGGPNGAGDGQQQPTQEQPTQAKAPLSYATDLNASIATLTTLSGDVTAEGSALKMASDASGKIGVVGSDGNSMTAMSNAAMVLKARSDLEDAIKAAEEDRTEAEAAKADTDDADVIAALDNAIAAANKQIMAAQAILDATGTASLAFYVQAVTGTDEDDMKNAADKGKEVADAIYTALTTPAQIPAVVSDFGTVPTATSDTVGKVMAGPSDAQGMTWAEIGGSDLVDKRIAATGGGTMEVKAKSVAGMTAGTLGLNAAPAIADGTEVPGTYKGIAGTLFCAGSDCKVEGTGAFNATTHRLTGSWYFTPSAPSMTTYLAGTGTAAGTYSVEAVTDYVRYGYWLSVASATDDTTTINRYVSGPDAQTGAVYGVDSDVTAFKDATARYQGNALGMSVVQTFDSMGKEVSRASGGFTADVSLTMRFGSSPSLDGTISNFQGDAVDTGWSVDLKTSELSGGELRTAPTNGTVGGDATSGAWTATAWGGAVDHVNTTDVDESARPMGVYGAFNAGFTNGAAAGVYATRKQ